MRSGSAMTSLRSPAPRIAASRVHVEAVRSLLAKAGLDESYLACGAHWPVSEAATRELMRSGRRPQAIHNNCSGKHAGMLAAAVHLGFDPRGYERPDHPLQSHDRENHFRDLRNRVGPEPHGDRRLLGADLGASARRARRAASRGSAQGRDLRLSGRAPLSGSSERALPRRFWSPAKGASIRSSWRSSRLQCSSKAAPRACIARRCLGSGLASR